MVSLNLVKVVIDISRLHSEAFKRGVGFYTRNLFEALKNLNSGGNQYILRKSSKEKIKADIIHFSYFDPFFLTLPIVVDRLVIVTIHDLIPLKFSQHFPPGLRGKIKWQIQKIIIKQAKAIITDSKNSKKDIEKIIGYSAERIFPIYLAPGKEFKKLGSASWRRKLEIKEKYQLPEIFLLYVGDLNWNKNIKGLVKAFDKLKAQSPKPKAEFKNLKLILVGSAFTKENLNELRELKKLVEELKIENDIKFLGFVPTNDLVAIYNLATLYVQPSFYEGFGLPVLEAMVCGCPVLSSNRASLPEVGEKAVEYFDPYKKGDLEEKLGNLISNFNKLKYLKRNGLRQVKKFSWEKTALETKKIYEKVCF